MFVATEMLTSSLAWMLEPPCLFACGDEEVHEREARVQARSVYVSTDQATWLDNRSTCCLCLDRSGDPTAIAPQPLSSGRLRPETGGSSELAVPGQREYGFLLFVEKPLNICIRRL